MSIRLVKAHCVRGLDSAVFRVCIKPQIKRANTNERQFPMVLTLFFIFFATYPALFATYRFEYCVLKLLKLESNHI